MRTMGPFHFFRKNQGMFLAVFGVLILIVFTVGPSIQSYQSTGGTGGDAVVAQWNPWRVPYLAAIPLLGHWFQGNDNVTENELIHLREMHILTHRVLDAIRPPTGSANANVSPLIFDTGDQFLIDLILVEAKAEELGIVVNDEMIDKYLNDLVNSDIKVKRSKLLNRLEGELRNVLYEEANGQMTELQFYDQLRRELTFHYLFHRFGASGASDVIFPGDLWTLHQRNSRQIEIEFLEVDALRYVAQVKETPSAKDSQEFFNRYRQSEQDPFPFEPGHLYPGFRYPDQIDFGYLHLNYQEDYYEPALETAKAAITDEQVKTYYDEHKLEYIKQPEPKEKPDAEKPDAEKPDAEKPDAKKPDAKKPDAKKPDAKKPDAKKPDAAEPCQQEPDQEKPAKEKPDQKKPDAKKPDAKKPDAKKPDAKKPDAKKPDAKNPDQKNPDAKKPDEGKPAADTETAPLIEYRPLEEVRDEIINALAEPQAKPFAETQFQAALVQFQRIQRVLTHQSGKIEVLYSEKNDLQKSAGSTNIKGQTDSIDKEIKALAASLQATIKELTANTPTRYGHTGKITIQDVRAWNEKEPNPEDPEFAALLRAQETRFSMPTAGNRSMNNQRITFAQLAFQEDVPNFEPFEIQQPFRNIPGFTPNHTFLFWRSDITKSYIPSWKEVRTEVDKSWQVRKAGDVAYQETEKLAAKAQKGKQALAELLPEREKEIKTPAKFAVSNFPFNDLQLNSESIEKLFQLKAGETVALRSAKYFPETGDFKLANSTYLVRLISTEPGEMQLRDGFLSSLGRFRTTAPVDPNQRFQIGSGWLQDLYSDVELHWNRTASRMGR